MTVLQAIEILKNFPQETEVLLGSPLAAREITILDFQLKKVKEYNPLYEERRDNLSKIFNRNRKSNFTKEHEELDKLSQELENTPEFLYKDCIVISSFFLQTEPNRLDASFTLNEINELVK